MKIGIFDSGLGGLIIAHSLITELPHYDFVYLGDTARVPYGNRSQETVYAFTEGAVRYLFNQNCKLVIVACNTASAEALRKIQQQFLPANHPDHKVLGVLIPAAEATIEATRTKRIGILATNSTVQSGAFPREIKKLMPEAEAFQQAAPLLVPLIENNGLKWLGPVLDEYLDPLIDSNVDCIVLGCTHYPFIKDMIREKVGSGITVISQDEIIPDKLRDYLTRHPEIETALTHTGTREFLVTDMTEGIKSLAKNLFGEPVLLQHVEL